MPQVTQRRLAAIVSADVVSYSRLMQADEAGTHARLKARYRNLVAPKIAEHGGRVVKLMGDGLLAEFPSVVGATEWAVELQRAVALANADVPSEHRLEYRIGVNLGDVIVDGDDIYGDGINIAARLQEVAASGGNWLSDVHRVRGDVATARGGEYWASAEAAYQDAIRVALEQGAPYFELRAATPLARLWHARGQVEEARALLEPIYSGFTEGLDLPDLVEAKAAIDQLA